MFRFFKELKRRNVHKRAISYVVFSWLAVQVIATLASLVSLPSWLGKTTLIILLIFFPIWITLSWFYDVTPSGIKKIETVEGEIIEEQNVAIGKRLNIFILIFLSLAVLLLIVDRTRLISKNEEITIINATKVTNSIAVLPFRDISANKNQAYFADGLAEELINMLSKISNIKVTSRTSAFSFKDKAVDIPSIAKQLDVNYILEGSVRAHDTTVRVIVQLIDAKKDSYSWSQSWDKKLENIFQIQNEISELVAQKLEIELTDNFINTEGKVNPEAYRLYLKANYQTKNIESEAKYNESLEIAKSLLKESIKLDSVFAPSWELLSKVYHQINNTSEKSIKEGYLLAKNAAYRAIEIDSTYATTYDILGTIAIDYEKDYEKAERLVNKGLAIEPNNIHVLTRASEVALILGKPNKALAYDLKTVSIDPLDEGAFYDLGYTYYFAEKYAEAEASFKKSIKLDPNAIQTYHGLSIALLHQNKLDAALEAAKKEPYKALRIQSLAMVYHALGEKEEASKYLSQLIEEYEEYYSYQIACVYAYRSDLDKTFYWLDKAVFYKDFGIIEAIIDPLFLETKKDPRWQEFLIKSKSLSVLED